MKRIASAIILIFITVLVCSCNIQAESSVKVQENQSVELTTDTAVSYQTSPQITTLETQATPNMYSIEQIDLNNIINTINQLSESPRSPNSEGLRKSITFLSTKLKDYGWQVTEYNFPVYEYDPMSKAYDLHPADSVYLDESTNIIGESAYFDPEKKTLILSAHYDTTDNNVGIIDNASGTACLLEIARLLADSDFPYNIRIVFFAREEYQMYGSKYYLQNIDESARENIVGNINLDMVGGMKNELKFATSNGYDSALSSYCSAILKNQLALDTTGMFSDSGSFMHYQIPALTLKDTCLPLKKEETSSAMEMLSSEALKQVCDTVIRIANNFSTEDFSKLLHAEHQTEYDTAQFKRALAIKHLQAKIGSGNIEDYTLKRIFTQIYPNGISSFLCCEYENAEGQKYSIRTKSEVTSEDARKVIYGIPTFEDCLKTVGDKLMLSDEFLGIEIHGDLSKEQLQKVYEKIKKG